MLKYARSTASVALVLVALVSCATAEATQWRWPDETPVQRVGAGRLISLRRPSIQQPQLPVRFNTPTTGLSKTSKPEGFSVNPAPALIQVPVVKQTTNPPPPPPPTPSSTSAPTTTSTTAAAGLIKDQGTVKTPEAPSSVDTETTTAGKNQTTSVPLLKDAGKPGNPYILLNDIFPPKNSIRTPEEEEASLNALQGKDLGGLEPNEVWLADTDLFVVRGFNFKKPYSSDPSGAPIHDYHAPAPIAPPPPEPGTVFYPTNKTETSFNFVSPDFNSTNAGDLPTFPYPFLPPPPPHWTEEQEFNDQNNNDLRDHFAQFGNAGGQFPFPQGGPGQGFSLFNGTQGPPPPSGLNGFPGNPQLGGPGSPPSQPPTGGPGGPGGQGGPGGPGSPPGGNFSVPEDDEEIPFTPLFAERPVEYYYPSHNTTAENPGPYGPGIFVPPPLSFFAPRDPNEVIKVNIPSKLFRPPFNLPNYYQKQRTSSSSTSGRPASPPKSVHNQAAAGLHVQKVPSLKPIPQQAAHNPSVPSIPGTSLINNNPFSSHQPQSASGSGIQSDQVDNTKEIHKEKPVQQNVVPVQPPLVKAPVISLPANVQLVPGTGPILLDTQFKEIGQTHKHLTNYGDKQISGQHPLHYPGFSSPGQSYYQSGSGPISLEGDINVNYQFPRPGVDPDSEIIDPIRLHQPQVWNPYSIHSQRLPVQQQQPQTFDRLVQPIAHQDYEQPASGGSDKPANFVTVYRLGGGSYSYNLGGRR